MALRLIKIIAPCCAWSSDHVDGSAAKFVLVNEFGVTCYMKTHGVPEEVAAAKPWYAGSTSSARYLWLPNKQ